MALCLSVDVFVWGLYAGYLCMGVTVNMSDCFLYGCIVCECVCGMGICREMSMWGCVCAGEVTMWVCLCVCICL